MRPGLSCGIALLILTLIHVPSGWVLAQQPPLDGTTAAAVDCDLHQHFQKQVVLLVVVVTAKASSVDRRTWLRTQFHKNLALLRRTHAHLADGVVLKFGIGTLALSQDALVNVTAEDRVTQDILLLPTADIDDPDPPVPGNDSATTLKVLHAARWAVKHYRFDYFVRLGDDAYFRVDHFLLNVAPTLPKALLMFGYCHELRYSVRNKQHDHVLDTVVPYCSGMGFFFTHDVTLFVAHNWRTLAAGYPEDVVVSSWFVGTRVHLQHDQHFVEWEFSMCSDQTIMVHKMRTAERWATIDDEGIARGCVPPAS